MNQFKNALSEMKLYDENRYLAAANKLGFSDNFMEHLKKERAYRSAMAEWKQYTEWVNNRNKDRSELELKYGYDTKHAMHLVRLMRMCREILQGKGVFVKRPDAEELLAIRNGSWKYDDLIEWAGKQDAELTEIM